MLCAAAFHCRGFWGEVPGEKGMDGDYHELPEPWEGFPAFEQEHGGGALSPRALFQ